MTVPDTYLNEPPLRGLWRASLPMIWASLVGPLMTLIDGVIVAGISTSAFNGLVLALPIVSLIGALGAGIAAGVGDAFAKASDLESRRCEAASALVWVLALGLLGLALAFHTAPWLPRAYGYDGSTATHEAMHLLHYWQIALWSLPLHLLVSLLLQLQTSLGRSRAAHRTIAQVALVNLGLDIVLVYGLDLGIRGAALALDLAFAAGLALLILDLRHELGWQSLRFEWLSAPRMRRQVVSSLAVAIGMGIHVIGDLLLTRVAVRHGPAAITALGIAHQVTGLIILPTRGLCAGFIAVFGAHLSARRTRRYFPLYWSATALVGVFYGPGAAALLLVPDLWLTLFGPLDAATHAVARGFLQLAGLTLLADVLPRIAQVGFLSLGHRAALVAQSLLVTGLVLAFAAHLAEAQGAIGIAQGRFFGHLLAAGLAFPGFVTLLSRRIRLESARP